MSRCRRILRDGERPECTGKLFAARKSPVVRPLDDFIEENRGSNFRTGDFCGARLDDNIVKPKGANLVLLRLSQKQINRCCRSVPLAVLRTAPRFVLGNALRGIRLPRRAKKRSSGNTICCQSVPGTVLMES